MIFRFGVFELHPAGRELRKAGMLIRLAPQPFQLLTLLVERPGAVVSRETIRRALWGEDTFVDFDKSVNVCVTQVRAALGDDPDSPRFVQTVPRRGYRFVAPVERTPSAGTVPAVVADPPPRRRNAVIALAALATVGAAATTWRIAGTPPGGRRALVAVMPLSTSETGEPVELFREGLLEETITQIGHAHPARLGAIARTSSVAVARENLTARQAAARLGAAYVLESAMQVTGGRARVTMRLVDAADESQRWASVFERDAAALAGFDEEIAARAAVGAAAALFPDFAARPREEIRCAGAWEEHRSARMFRARGATADLDRAVERFEEAIRRDRRCAAAHAGLADTLFALTRRGQRSEEIFSRAREAAREALRLDPANAEAVNALAGVVFWKDWNFAEAGRLYRRAIERNPSFAEAHHDYAWLLTAAGRSGDGVASLRRAIALDPLSVRINIDAGWLLLQAHRFREAADQASRALELDPDLAEARFCRMRALFFLGESREALASLAASRSASPYHHATLAAMRGDRAAALAALESALTERSAMMVMLASDPAFRELHGEARFQELLRRIGLR